MEKKMGFIYSLSDEEFKELKKQLGDSFFSALQKNIFNKMNKTDFNYCNFEQSLSESRISFDIQAKSLEKKFNRELNEKKQQILHFLPEKLLNKFYFIFKSDVSNIHLFHSKKFKDLSLGICEDLNNNILNLSECFNAEEINSILRNIYNELNFKTLEVNEDQSFKDICDLLTKFKKEITVNNVMQLIEELNI